MHTHAIWGWAQGKGVPLEVPGPSRICTLPRGSVSLHQEPWGLLGQVWTLLTGLLWEGESPRFWYHMT